MLYITRRVKFSAAHRLFNPALSPEENRRIFGVCENPGGHGHNYALEVTVRGEVPARTGMVMDLKALQALLEERVLSAMDHRHLNQDVPCLAGIIPTAENVAVKIWGIVDPALEGCELYRVRLFESEDNFVEYYGPKGRPRD
ncbi:MAG TPA: 6-carboxytetrahydropterin synthase [Planctomycetota bacterium]|jgi:6-pyruvoyltetrahydropterin/6-carboxytetrahydropterin synthase|nr:6-carboxytetrahydropterin synthase [Planctomycetota bacterium]